MFAFWSTGYSAKLGAYPKCLQKLNNCNDEAMVISQRPNLFRKHRHKFMLHHLNADHDVSIFAKDKLASGFSLISQLEHRLFTMRVYF